MHMVMLSLCSYWSSCIQRCGGLHLGRFPVLATDIQGQGRERGGQAEENRGRRCYRRGWRGWRRQQTADSSIYTTVSGKFQYDVSIFPYPGVHMGGGGVRYFGLAYTWGGGCVILGWRTHGGGGALFWVGVHMGGGGVRYFGLAYTWGIYGMLLDPQ